MDSFEENTNSSSVDDKNSPSLLHKEKRMKKLYTKLVSERQSKRNLFSTPIKSEVNSEVKSEPEKLAISVSQIVPSLFQNTLTAPCSEFFTLKKEIKSKNTLLLEEYQIIKSIVDFPNEILYKILKFLPFEMITKTRMVCRHFNVVCSDVLNSEFKCLRNIVQQRLIALKSQMPRRESARRQHPRHNEYDIIETVNMRLSLMQTIFSKHIDRSHCAFFAGQVLDEVRRILVYLKTTPVLNVAYKVTEELFDLSTMAVDYFKDRIEPTLPDINYIGGLNDLFLFENGSNSPGNSFDLSNNNSYKNTPEYCSSIESTESKSSDFLNKTLIDSEKTFASSNRPPLYATLSRAATIRIKKLETKNKRTTSAIRSIRCDLKLYKKKLIQNQRQIRKYRTRFDDCEKKLESTCSKLNLVLEELSKCKTEMQYLRSRTTNPSNQFNGLSNSPLAKNICGTFLTSPSTSTKEMTGVALSKAQSKEENCKRKLQLFTEKDAGKGNNEKKQKLN